MTGQSLREEIGDEPPQGFSFLLLQALEVLQDGGIDVDGGSRHDER
jgi:hypothetical protein